ncbi:MmgE/PrpD family protein [Orbus mooreae]|uniref:MmgE/PrpD family protein n=1 Tax=Orbus mooreae TaxID=3074107 RepID=UPI00370DAFE8
MLTVELVNKIMQSQPLGNPKIVDIALNGITDYFAAIFLANQQPECLRLLGMIQQEGGYQQHWLIGYEHLATAKQAALFNGFQAHLLDYDDVHSQVRGHPSAVILSALFSQISLPDQKSSSITGRQFLSAYVVGIEVMARLGEAIGEEHYLKGWHNTATLGGIAATAAICYLWQYPFTAQAMAIAASQAAGLRLQFGSNMKPLHAGLAAQQAVQSVELCCNRLSANDDFLNEKIGFLALYGKGNQALDLSQWGDVWRIDSPGLWFKNYPYCSANSYVADAVQTILASNPITIEQIESIDIAFSTGGDAALIYRQPQIQAQGRFSAEYVIACLLQGKVLNEYCFAEQQIDSDTVELMTKVQRSYLPNAEHRCVKLEIVLHDKQRLSAIVTHPKGSPENPYSQQELFSKLSDGIGAIDNAQIFYQVLHKLNSTASVQTVLGELKNTSLNHKL